MLSMQYARSSFAMLCGLVLLLPAAAARATPSDLFGTFCAPYVPGGLNGLAGAVTCAETAVGGAGPGDPLGFNGSVVSPDTTVRGTPSSTAGGGGGGVFGSATAIADFGHLRAQAGGTNPNSSPTISNINARALASFNDNGPINSISLVS